MSKSCSYEIYTKWGARAENPAALATRFLRTIDTISALDPLLQKWSWADAVDLWETEGIGGIYPLETILPRITDSIARNAMTGGDEKPNPANGFMIATSADRTTEKCEAGISISAGDGQSYGSEIHFVNSASMDFGPAPNPNLIRYPVVREAMLILCEAWEVTVGEAWPSDIKPHWTNNLARIAWMKYVSPRFAPLITPPPSVIAERRPNGGLFLAATEQTFDTANPAHMKAARAIEAALQPLLRIYVYSTNPTNDRHLIENNQQ